MTITIEKATLDDLDAIHQWSLALEALEQMSTTAIPLSLHQDFPERVRDWLQDLLANDRALFLIAREDTTPIGFILGYIIQQANNFTVYENHGVIQILWVDDSHRRCGIAKELVAQMEQCFANTGVPYCEIQYAHGNQAAEKFWQSQHYLDATVTGRKFFK